VQCRLSEERHFSNPLPPSPFHLLPTSMVDFNNPAVIEDDFMAVTKFWHTLAGLYFWEFVTTLDYEWSVIRGRRPYRRTIWIYSVTRMSTLVSVILHLVSFDVTARYNCEAQYAFHGFLGYLAIAAASLLMVFRIIAIWKMERFVIAIVAGVWVANVGFMIQSVARIRTSWIPESGTCGMTNIHTMKLNLIVTLITDIALLLIMLIGLLRRGFNEPDVFRLGRLMWRQGLIWFFLATIAEVPPVVFISLNLNTPFDAMFQIPAMITLSIAATRIYRSLVDFASRSTEIGFIPSKTDRAPAPPPISGPMEAARHETYEAQQNIQNASTITSDGILHETPTGLGRDFDLERGAENQTRLP